MYWSITVVGASMKDWAVQESTNHSGANIAEVFKEAVTEWELERDKHGFSVITDNARNMDVAVK